MGKDDEHDDYNPWHHRNKNYLNSKVMLSAIISLSIVIVIVILLQIYARCILKRQSRRRSTSHPQLRLVTTSAHVNNSDQQPKTGLDPSIIASLPIFEFRKSSDDNNISNNGGSSAVVGSSHECSVCLSMLEDGEMARTLPNCKHTFHAECIDKWFSSQSTCPICRTEAEPKQLQPTAPPLDQITSASVPTMEGTSSQKIVTGNNESSSCSRLSSFRRILTRERSSQRVNCGQEDTVDDLERQ